MTTAPRVPGRDSLHARADEGRLGPQQGNRLALHVRAHERAVGVVVLQERNQRGGHAHQLLRRDVHVVHLLPGHHDELAAGARRDELVEEVAPLIDGRVGLGDFVFVLVNGREPFDGLADAAAHHPAAGRLDESVLIHARIGGEARYQPDVRPLGRLDGAYAAIVGGVNVAHLEAGPVARQPPGTQGREPALVGNLRQRIRLVHELAQLAGAEKLLHRRRYHLGVDEVANQDVVEVLDSKALPDGALHAHEANAKLALEQFADGAHAPVAEVVDVVHRPLAVTQLDDVAHRGDDVLERQGSLIQRKVQSQLRVQLQAPDVGQVVSLGVEEEVLEELPRRLRRRRIARAQALVDFHEGVFLRLALVGGVFGRLALVRGEGVSDGPVRTDAGHVEDGQPGDFLLPQRGEHLGGDLQVRVEEHLAGLRVGHRLGQNAPDDLLVRQRERPDARALELSEGGARELPARPQHQLARIGKNEVLENPLVHHEVGELLVVGVALLVVEDVLALVERIEDVVLLQAKRAQQDGDGKLATPIDSDVQ